MKIKLNKIMIRDIYEGYIVNDEDGEVLAYRGKLNIRPKYQREFVYKDKQRDAVINSINNNFPLNVMYWVENDDGNYEVLDGQQRTISICEYISKNFSINQINFDNLPNDKKEIILNYELMIYICKGSESEKLDWFKTINIAGEKLTDQELRNAIYSGGWLSAAKKFFSKNNCVAYKIGNRYLCGTPIRQDFLETTIKWISDGEIEKYMSKHQHDKNCDELVQYYKNVIEWVESTFTNYRKEMKGLKWGEFYNKFKNKKFDSRSLELEINKLMIDDDVTNKKGIYEFVLTRQEKVLNIRAFSMQEKRTAYEKQHGICVKCGRKFGFDSMEADHIDPWSIGGKTKQANCQVLCKECNRRKSNI